MKQSQFISLIIAIILAPHISQIGAVGFCAVLLAFSMRLQDL